MQSTFSDSLPGPAPNEKAALKVKIWNWGPITIWLNLLSGRFHFSKIPPTYSNADPYLRADNPLAI